MRFTKEIKQFISICISLALICGMLCVLPMTASAIEIGKYGALSYNISNGEIVITDCNSDASGDLEIPAEIDGYPVTRIGVPAFQFCRSLTSVTIPDSVTSIETLVFSNCSSLESIQVDENNQYYSFYDGVLYNKDKTQLICCPNGKKEVKIPNSVTSIGRYAFDECSALTNIDIPNSITSIERGVFGGCSSLTSIVIPDSVTSIGDYAFGGCSSLTSIVIPDSVTSIGDYAFNYCSSLTSIVIPDSVTSIGDYVFNNCSSLTSINIPDGVTSIYRGMFENCSALTSVDIPDSVTSIGDYAFAVCSALTSINISNNVTSIGYSAFENCSALSSINIPDSVTSMGWFAFRDCSSLTSINIPNGVTSIEYCAFSGCSSLTSIDIPDSVTSIDGRAFQCCSSLVSIDIPDSVASIGFEAFYNCSALASIVIPSSVTSIEYQAFNNCNNISNVLYTGTETEWNSISIETGSKELTDAIRHYKNDAYVINIVEVVAPTCLEQGYTVYRCSVCGKEGKNNYVYALGHNFVDGVCTNCKESFWKYLIRDNEAIITGCYDPAGDLVIPDTVDGYPVKWIGEQAFDGCSGLTSVVIPKGVTLIGGWAFGNCYNLKSVVIPESVTRIGEHAFDGCSSLTSVVIPDGVTTINMFAFSDCSNLKSVVLHNSVVRIEDIVFSGCKNISHVLYFGNEDEWNGIYIGTNNECLTNATRHYEEDPSIRNIVETVAPTCTEHGYTIYRCSECSEEYTDDYTEPLGHNYIDGVCANCGENFWYYELIDNEIVITGCDEPIGDLVIPATIDGYPVTGIGEKAFNNFKSLTSIEIPESVTSIGDNAFNGCDNLTVLCPKGSYAEAYAMNNDIPYAYTEAPEPPQYTPSVTLSSVEAGAGETVEITVSLDNNPGVSNMKLYIDYDPAVMTLEKVTDLGNLGNYLEADISQNPCLLEWSNSYGEYPYSGEIAVLTFRISDNAASGSYPVSAYYNDGDIYNLDLEKVDFEIKGGFVTVSSDFVFGDVDGSGEVDALDVTILSRYVAKWSGVALNEFAADVDGSGEIDALDVTMLSRYVAKWSGIVLGKNN